MNPGVVDNDDEEKGRPPQLPPTASQQPDVMTSTTSFLPQQQDAHHHHHAALPNSDSSGSIEPSKTPVHSSGSSASFLPPIFGGGGSERDSSRSGSDSAESRTDFTVAPPSGAASTSGWHLSSRGGSVARHSGSTSHSDSPNSNKSPTKLPRLEGGGGGGSGLGSVGGGVFSPESIGSAAGLTTPLLTPRLTFMGATTNLEGAPREAVPEEFFSSPEPELSTELLKADPLTQLFLQSNINQQQQPPQFAASNVLRLPSIDSSATSSSGLSPRSIFLQESAGASTLHQELQQGGSASPPHLHQSKHGGVKRKHRRRRKGSELPSETQQQRHLPPSDQLVEACQSEDHIRQGLCERNAACYVDAAEAFARSSGFTLPGEPLEENDLDSETTTTTRVEFDLPDEVDIEDPPQQQRLYHSHHARPPDDDSITDERLESVNYADDEMFSNESPRDSDVETPLAAHDTPTPHNCCEAVHHPEPCDDALEMICGTVSGDAQSLGEVVEDASQGAPS